MTKQTINKLNQLNLNFYQKFAQSFNQTRDYYWEGWEKILPTISQLNSPIIGNSNRYVSNNNEPKTRIKVVDIGCGTARFASFLNDRLLQNTPTIKINYLGLDSSSHILAIAQKRLNTINNQNFDYQTAKLDLTQLNLPEKSFNLITMFGVLHHLPSFKLRQKVVQQLVEKLEPRGRLIITLWRFPLFDRLKKKIVDPRLAGIDPKELEENDYILDWKKSGVGYRYCHHTTLEEMRKLLGEVGSIENTFLADAKEKTVNRYIIIKP